MRRISRPKLVLLGLAAVLPVHLPAAEATATVHGTFVAHMTTGNPLVIPGTPPPTTTNFTLHSVLCADGQVASKYPPGAGTGCSLSAAGTLTGWCGAATGAGGGTFVTSVGTSYVLELSLIVIAGTTFTATGEAIKGTQKGPLTIDALIVPDVLQGDSCITGADSYLLIGDIDFSVVV